MANASALAVIILAVGVIGQGILPMVVGAHQTVQYQAPYGRYFQQGSNFPVRESIPCTLCKRIVEAARDFFVHNPYVDELVQFLHNYCKTIPSDLGQACDSLTDEIPALVKAFADQFLDPDMDCAAVCPDPKADQLRNIIGDLANRLK